LKESIVFLNKNARKQRHRRLFGSHNVLKKCLSKCKFCGDSSDVQINSVDVHNTKSDLSRFFWKVNTVVLAVFILYSAVPTYALGQAVVDQDVDMNTEFVEQELATTNTGFLMNSAGQSTIGARSDMSDTLIYVVQSGDTLSKIAQKFQLNISTITWANNIIDSNQLKVGTKLTILPVDGVFHKIEKGDNLDKIAKKYKVEKDPIIAQNKIDDKSLVVGKYLIVPGGKVTITRDYIAYNRGQSGKRTAPNNVKTNIPRLLKSGSTSAVGYMKMIKPAAGKYTQYYHRGHYAVDIAHAGKGPIFAAASGKVIKAAGGWNGGYGNVIIIDHGNGFKTLYAHNEVLYVKVGDYVTQGQTISWMGNTGRVYGRTGIHLHFEVIKNGVKKNPLSYF